MLIPANIIKQVQEDASEGAIEALSYLVDQIAEEGHEWSKEEHAILIETYALIGALREGDLIKIKIIEPNVTADIQETCKKVWQYLLQVKESLEHQVSATKLESLKKHFAMTVANGFGYEFSEGDLARIQTLLNELRDLVGAASDLEADHKQRLLKRLENLQQELHKKTSDLSRYYGLLGEAGVALGKFGTDAKPIVDRIKEILQITWNTQARAEELPSGTTPPLLEKDSD